MADLLDDRGTWSTANCTIAAALDVIGTRGTLVVLREASLGTRRFADFVTRTHLSEPNVAARLRGLVEGGLLERRSYQEPGSRSREEYVLTGKGRDLVPVLIALREWGDAYAAGPDGPPLRSVHRHCGADVHVALRCDAGHDVPLREISLQPGPGLLRRD